MVNTRLSGSGGAKSIVGAMAICKSDAIFANLLQRATILMSKDECSRAMLQRLVTQDRDWCRLTCILLSSGILCEPGLNYASVDEALDVLGTPLVCYSAQIAWLASMYAHLCAQSVVDAKSLLLHSLTTSLSATHLASDVGVTCRTAQIAGLLHKIGVAVAAFAYRKDYETICHGLLVSSCSLHEAENIQLGFDHGALGKCLLAQAGLNESVGEAIAQCQNDLINSSPLAQCISIGATIAEQMGFSTGLKTKNQDLDSEMLSILGFSPSKIEENLRIVSEATTKFSQIPWQMA